MPRKRVISKRVAEAVACGTVHGLIDSYFAVGQPFAECADTNHPDDESCVRCDRIADGLKEIMGEMERRSAREGDWKV